jgi:hypothetical protein
MATGWAVEVDGEIKVRTIMDAKLGAMVNYLATEHRAMVKDGTSESQIEELVAAFSGGTATVVEVTISRKLHA